MIREGESGEFLEWATAGRPLAGEHVSGDLHVVAPFSAGVLVGVIDGLGHGPEAAAAARTAAAVLLENAGMSVDALVMRCHLALGRLRGAVMSLASFDAGRADVTWLGVGNVEAVLVRLEPTPTEPRHERLLLRGGIVGQMLPMLRPATVPVFPGDTLVLATDGVNTTTLANTSVRGTAQEIAGAFFASHAKGTDDALVLVARFLEASP